MWQSWAVTRADLDKQPHEVAEMFDGVAKRYDLTNTILAFGQDRGWRRARDPRGSSTTASLRHSVAAAACCGHDREDEG